jgi:ABC-type transport system involved in cytochrome c biogenesis permease component
VIGWAATALCGIAFATAAVWPVQPHWVVFALPVVIWAVLFFVLLRLIPPYGPVCDRCMLAVVHSSRYCRRCGRAQPKGVPRPWTRHDVVGLSVHLLLTTVVAVVALAIGRQVRWDAADQPGLFWVSVGLALVLITSVMGLRIWCTA